MKIGVISDTHGFLDPRVPGIFDGVEHILHAGDIGPGSILVELERIAPVTAVLGNNDFELRLREIEAVELGGRKFLLQHIVTPGQPCDTLKHHLAREAPDAVVFGHTHQPFAAVLSGVLYFNPGYAGKPRFKLTRSVAILHLAQGIRHEFVPL